MVAVHLKKVSNTRLTRHVHDPSSQCMHLSVTAVIVSAECFSGCSGAMFSQCPRVLVSESWMSFAAVVGAPIYVYKSYGLSYRWAQVLESVVCNASVKQVPLVP